MRTIVMTRPDDWHVHCRDETLLTDMVLATARHFSRALLMPNLSPPLTTVEALLAYRERVKRALPLSSSFEPYMTLYINDSMPVAELDRAKLTPGILGGKLYPAGATTNSEQGVRVIEGLYPLFERMEALDLVLQIHGEVVYGDIFEREAQFIEEYLLPICKRFPALRIVLEHISTQEAVQFVSEASKLIAATITPHHLAYNRNHLLAGGVRPHYYCLPILKHERDQRALQQAAFSGNPKFFAGTDSAPHLRSQKERSCGCAGIFSAPYAVAMYAQVFDEGGALDRLEAFMSHFGAAFYQLPVNAGQITLVEVEQCIPEVLSYSFGEVVPAGAGTVLQWSMMDVD